MTWRAALAAVLALGLLGCASDKPSPTPLEAVEAKIAGRQVWSARIGAVQFPLGVAVRDGQFIVADSAGTVLALADADGRELWRSNVGARISAGVGSDGRFAAVVTRGNELVVLERGTERWRKRLNSLTTTPPLVAGERVFVMGVDRVVLAFDALDGRSLWQFQRAGEPLTLAQPGVLMPWRDTLVVGQGHVLTGLDPLRGTVRWDLPLANPRGTNEVERLADLVGPGLRVGDVICARAFQSAVGCANPQGPSLRWSRNVGGIRAVGGDADLMAGADVEDPFRRDRLDQREVPLPGSQRAADAGPGRGVRRCRRPGALPRARRRPGAASPAHRRLARGDAAGGLGHDRAGGHARRRVVRFPPAVIGRPTPAGRRAPTHRDRP